MNIKKSTMAVAVSALIGLGVSAQASASVYAGSRVAFEDLTIDIGGVTGTEGFGYTFNIDNTALLNGTAATGNLSTSCDSLGVGGVCGSNPVLTADAASVGTPARVDGAANNFDFFGPGSGQTYAGADAQINTAQVTGEFPTSGIAISEAEVSGTGTGQSSTNIQSNTQFVFSFVTTGGTLVLDFDADPDLYVAVDTLGLIGASAQANSGATFTLVSTNGTNVRWSPDGLTGGTEFTSCVGVTSCTEDNDEESLNNTVGLPLGNPSSEGISDDRLNVGDDLGMSNFGITIAGLLDGSYSLTLAQTTSVNVLQSVGVPEPGVLGIFGAGLVGLGFARRRKSRKA